MVIWLVGDYFISHLYDFGALLKLAGSLFRWGVVYTLMLFKNFYGTRIQEYQITLKFKQIKMRKQLSQTSRQFLNFTILFISKRNRVSHTLSEERENLKISEPGDAFETSLNMFWGPAKYMMANVN